MTQRPDRAARRAAARAIWAHLRGRSDDDTLVERLRTMIAPQDDRPTEPGLVAGAVGAALAFGLDGALLDPAEPAGALDPPDEPAYRTEPPVAPEARRFLARMLRFLRSDASYGWPGASLAEERRRAEAAFNAAVAAGADQTRPLAFWALAHGLMCALAVGLIPRWGDAAVSLVGLLLVAGVAALACYAYACAALDAWRDRRRIHALAAFARWPQT